MKFWNWLRACAIGFGDWLQDGCAHDWDDGTVQSSGNGWIRVMTHTCKKCGKERVSLG